MVEPGGSKENRGATTSWRRIEAAKMVWTTTWQTSRNHGNTGERIGNSWKAAGTHTKTPCLKSTQRPEPWNYQRPRPWKLLKPPRLKEKYFKNTLE